MAAGEGLRMLPLTKETPKPMLEVQGITLLEHQISFLKHYVDSVAVTVGYMSEKVSQCAIQNGADYIFKNESGGNANWLNRPLFRGLSSPIVIITCDNLMEIDLNVIETESKTTPNLSYLVSRHDNSVIKGDRIVQTAGRVTSISQDKNISSLATGLQVLNTGSLSPAQNFDSFHDVWGDLIGNQLLFVSKSQPSKWTAIDTPLDLENVRESW